MKRISDVFNRNTRRKVDTAGPAADAKLEIRRNVLNAIGPADASVFDAFAGSGHMHRNVWSNAARYVGCDLLFYRDGPRAYVADNHRVMRCIDLAQFNIFDFDSYGSPWEQIIILIARRPVAVGEQIGLVLTEGTGMTMRMSTITTALAVLAGVRPASWTKPLPGLATERSAIINRAITSTARQLHTRIVRRWEAHQAGGKGTGANMRYIGLVLKGEGTPP